MGDDLPMAPGYRRALADGLNRLPWLAAAAVLIWAVTVAWPLVSSAGLAVTVTVDGFREPVRTSRATVGQLLADLGVSVRPEDRVAPGLDAPLAPGMAVTVQRARPGRVAADGTTFTAYTHAQTAGALLAEAGLRRPVETVGRQKRLTGRASRARGAGWGVIRSPCG